MLEGEPSHSPHFVDLETLELKLKITCFYTCFPFTQWSLSFQVNLHQQEISCLQLRIVCIDLFSCHYMSSVVSSNHGWSLNIFAALAFGCPFVCFVSLVLLAQSLPLTGWLFEPCWKKPLNPNCFWLDKLQHLLLFSPTCTIVSRFA